MTIMNKNIAKEVRTSIANLTEEFFAASYFIPPDLIAELKAEAKEIVKLNSMDGITPIILLDNPAPEEGRSIKEIIESCVTTYVPQCRVFFNKNVITFMLDNADVDDFLSNFDIDVQTWFG